MLYEIDSAFHIRVDEDITLCLPKEEDALELFTLIDRNRTHLREFLGWVDYTKEVADSEKFIRENLPSWRQLNSLHLSILKNNEIIGAVGLHKIDFSQQSAYIGYWLDEKYQGKGIVTKSVKALIDYTLIQWGLKNMHILCAVQNIPSQKIALSLGFNKKEALKNAIPHYGAFLDAYLYTSTPS